MQVTQRFPEEHVQTMYDVAMPSPDPTLSYARGETAHVGWARD